MLGAVRAKNAPHFNLALKLIKGTNAEFSTSAHIAQNTCYRLAGFLAQKLNRRTK